MAINHRDSYEDRSVEDDRLIQAKILCTKCVCVSIRHHLTR